MQFCGWIMDSGWIGDDIVIAAGKDSQLVLGFSRRLRASVVGSLFFPEIRDHPRKSAVSYVFPNPKNTNAPPMIKNHRRALLDTRILLSVREAKKQKPQHWVPDPACCIVVAGGSL
jgi:hypothetical protein